MQQKNPLLSNVHGRYEELCALVAAQEASDVESAQLREHLEKCEDCRNLLRELENYLADKCAQAIVPDGMTETFMGRLRSSVPGKGIVRPLPPRSRMWVPSLAFLAVATILCVAAFTMYWRVHNRASGPNTGPAQVIVYRDQEAGSHTTDALNEVAEFKEKLRKAVIHVAELEQRAMVDQETIRTSDSEKKDLLARIAGYDATVADLRSVAEGRDGTIRQLQQDLASRESAIQAKDSELKTAAARTLETEQHLKQERERNAILDQLETLFAVKNLHVADIHDDGVAGNRRFGRVLYAKGHGLMFYAYGLADGPQLNANVTYHLWGEQKEVAKTIKSLGILQKDNAQHGWRLICNDLNALNQIDSVFVTAEKKAVAKPAGEKMLSASFGDTANHP